MGFDECQIMYATLCGHKNSLTAGHSACAARVWSSLPQPLSAWESLMCSQSRGTFKMTNHLLAPQIKLSSRPAPLTSAFCPRALAQLAPHPLPGKFFPQLPRLSPLPCEWQPQWVFLREPPRQARSSVSPGG